MSARKPATPVLEPVLLLDLGAAWLRAALVLDGRPLVISFPSEGGRIPCCVGFDEDQLVLGDLARRLTLTQPRSQVTRSLRLAGVRYELAELAAGEWRQVPVVRGPGADVHFELAEQRWPLPRLLGVLIQQLVAQVERQREVRLERVTVAVPPGSDDARRRAIVHSLHVAGFAEVSLIHSTTAAAIAWSKLEREGATALGFAGLESMLAASKPAASAPGKAVDDDSNSDDESDDDDENKGEGASDGESAEAAAEHPAEQIEEIEEQDAEPETPREQSVLVLDLGAGSFSAALVRLDGGSVEVLAARSRCDLGGDSIDERIVEWMLERFEDEAEVDLSGDAHVRARMRDVAEKSKIALTDAERCEVRLPYLWADPSGPKHLFVTLERGVFERMIHDIVAAVAALAQSVVADAGQDPNELDAVVMVGGTSRIPILQDRLEGLFGRVPETELGNPALDEDFVVRGLALDAHRRNQRRPSTQVVEIASRDIWLEREGGEPQRLIERGSPLPVRRSFDVTLLDGGYRAWLWEGDEDDRSRGPSLRVTLRSKRKQVALQLQLDGNGELRVGLDREADDVELRVDQRVGLSARALRRFRLEADERARIAAERDKHEQLRRRVQELVRTIEGWLTDPKLDLDELLRTSLLAWNRDAEASFEAGDAELFTIAIEAFLGLSEALPTKLRNQIDATALAAQVRVRVSEEGEGEEEAGEDEEPLGDESEDYDEAELVALLAGAAEDEDEDAAEEESGEDEESDEDADADEGADAEEESDEESDEDGDEAQVESEVEEGAGEDEAEAERSEDELAEAVIEAAEDDVVEEEASAEAESVAEAEEQAAAEAEEEQTAADAEAEDEASAEGDEEAPAEADEPLAEADEPLAEAEEEAPAEAEEEAPAEAAEEAPAEETEEAPAEAAEEVFAEAEQAAIEGEQAETVAEETAAEAIAEQLLTAEADSPQSSQLEHTAEFPTPTADQPESEDESAAG